MFEKILPLKYTKLGSFDFDTVSVYKLKDNGEQLDIGLEGTGTFDDPYLIQTESDLRLLSNLVNNGMTFEKQYVRQTADIDMNNVPMTPIGRYTGECYFYGVYDGAGHTIRNIALQGEGIGNIALFARLGGEVYNLGIEGGTLSGGYSAVIACEALSTNAKIVNCYTDVAMDASRAGGIADNYIGAILNCVSVGNLHGTENADAISYNNASVVENVYQREDTISRLFSVPSIKEKRIIYGNAEAMNSDELLNRLMTYVLNENGVTDASDNQNSENKIKLAKWERGTDGHPVLVPEN